VQVRVADDERLTAREHLANFRVVREVDLQIAQARVVARREHVPDAVVAEEHDAATVDERDLRDALNDQEQDVAHIQGRGELLRELEHRLLVTLAGVNAVQIFAHAELSADPLHELGGVNR
jgi:hypothetical protein